MRNIHVQSAVRGGRFFRSGTVKGDGCLCSAIIFG